MASVASSEKLSGGEFFLKGWKGDEGEEVDICSSDDGGSFGFENEEGVGEVGGEVGFQQLGKRKRMVSPSGSSISRDTGPCSPRPDSCKRLTARAYRSSFHRSDTKPGTSKGKEHMDEGTSSMSQRDLKRKQIAAEERSPWPRFRDLSSENLCTWNTQWVCCSRCKKWRRIPYDVDVETAIWECKDNGWSAIHASCDYPQDVQLKRLNEMIDHVCGLSVDLSAAATHATGSSLDEELDSDDNGSHEHVANQTCGKPSESETAAKDMRRTSGQTSEVSKEHKCQKCGFDGHMISCSLCQSSYHVRCLDPPLIDPVAQGWHCEACSNRTGVESVYMCANKDSYYVKWKGRGHVHNSTLTEAELAKLAPKKLAYLKKRQRVQKAVKWDSLWAEPQRIIAKRETESGQTEWLVKWRGLSYAQCTWEPADSGVCASESGLLLARRYEQWCEAASNPSAQAVESPGKLDELSTRPEWMKSEKMEQHQLEMLNKLRECWFNRKEGIVLCKLNQEHMISVLAFILWLCRVSCVSQPILMVMPSEMLHLWDKKLGELQPELNSVVFHGSPEARQVIQRYEFDLIDGRPKFNIVISTSDSVISALDLLNTFAWSALLVDEGHVKVGKSFFRSIGLLHATCRFIFSTLFEPCKNNLQDLLQMLAIFDEDRHEDSTLQLADVMEKLHEHVVYDHKVRCSNFNREFWVPVEMSPVQIHRYCETLVEYYELLRSGNMSLGDAHLQNIFQLLQSCCCHPYIGTEKMIKSVEEVAPPEDYLRLGIRASGKLEFLHRLLLQYHTEKKTILILVQPNSSELKNILDDYLRQQFGSGSYVRIERRMDAKARQSALMEFNDNGSGCFVLLLDRNAPVYYQLRDLDAVFIYESDWNPWNDTSYVQSLGIGNKYRIYRLYTCHSIEEKILLYARQGLSLCSLRTVSAKRFQEILQWGAKLLFEMDNCNLKYGASTDARIGWEDLIEDLPISLRKHLVFLNDAEMKQLAATSIEATTCSEKLKNILSPRDPSSEGAPLYGVSTNVVLDGSGSAESFWSLLLKDKHAEFMQLNEPKKLRKREPVIENESRKKAKLQHQRGIETAEAPRDSATDTALGDADLSPGVCSAEVPEENSPSNAGYEEATSVPASSTKSMQEEQQEFLDTLKPEMKFICDSLKMPANVLGRAEELLDFAANNLRMNQDYLRELELSLCWIAAEQLEVSFDLSEAVSVVSTTYNTTVDEDAVAAVCLKLKDQFCVSLPQLSKSIARSSEDVQRSPERVTSDSSQELLPGRVQAEIDAEMLERKKADLLRLRSLRRMKLLDFQKAEWCRLVASKEAEIEKAKRVCNMECRIVEVSVDAQFEKLQKITGRKSELDARLKAIEERHSKERQTLLVRQRSCRELENCVIASHLDQLRDGFLPGPLPELILPEVSSTIERVTEDLLSDQERFPSQARGEERISPDAQGGQQSQTTTGEKENSPICQQEYHQKKLPDVPASCGKSREGQVSHREQAREANYDQRRNAKERLLERDGVLQTPSQEVTACSGEQRSKQQAEIRVNEGDGESSEHIIDEGRSLAAQAEQQRTAEAYNQPQTASAVRMSHLQMNGPPRQDIQAQAQEQVQESQNIQTRSLSAVAAQGHTQVYAPAIVSTRSPSAQPLQQSSASQQAQSRMQLPTHRSASSERCHLAPQRQIGAAARCQDSAAGIQRQAQQFLRATIPTQPMEAQSQTQTHHLSNNQVHHQITAPLRASNQTQSQVQAAGPIRQVAVQDPLSNEEAKLIKERERTKKVFNEEVARVQQQYQQTMETLQRTFRQRDESFGINLQKAAEQRRLADALRKRDRLGVASPRRQAGRSDYILQLNPLVPVFQNSISGFQSLATSFQGSNQIPVQQSTNISPGTQPVPPFLITGAGTRPSSPCFIPVHQVRLEHPRPHDSGAGQQTRLERDQVVAPTTARADQQQPCLQFATQRLFGTAASGGIQQQPVARNDPVSTHFRLQQQPRMNQGSPGTEQSNFQLRLQPHQHHQPRPEHINQHLRNTTGGDIEQVTSSLSRLNHHVRTASPSSLEQVAAQFRLQQQQCRTEQGGQHVRPATAGDCTGAEQFRPEQQARIEQASQQLRPAEQHFRVSEGRGTEQVSSQFRLPSQARVPRSGEWPPQLFGTSPVTQTRVGGEQLPSPQFHMMVQQPFGQRAPPWNPPQQMLRAAAANTPITNNVNQNIIIQNNNIVSNNVNAGAVTQAQANELRASSQNMYTSIGRQLQLGTGAMLGSLDPRLFSVRPVQQQHQQQRLPQQYHVQLPLDGPAVMSERDYIYLSDDE